MREKISILVLVILLLFSFSFKEDSNYHEYFDLGDKLVEKFQGTYAFKNEVITFTKKDNYQYCIHTEGDMSPSNSILKIEDKTVTWINPACSGNGWETDEWYKFKLPFKEGSKWTHILRGYKETYQVMKTNVTVKTPAGEFKKCIEIKISWIANEPDMSGLQEELLFLAPHLAIIKKQAYSNKQMWHEEFLKSYSK